MIKKNIVMLLVMLMCIYTGSSAAKTLLFNGIPLELTITKGDDYIFRFEEPMRVGMSPSLKQFMSVSSAEKYVVLSSSTDFVNQKVTFQGMDTAKPIDIRLSVVDGPIKNNDNEIIIKRATGQINNNNQTEKESLNNSRRNEKLLGDYKVTMSRFVFHDLELSGIGRIKETPEFKIKAIKTNYEDGNIQGLYRHGELDATIIRTYKSKYGYATSILLTNATSRKVIFDPTKMRGKWESVIPYYWNMKPSESTVVIVIHQSPLNTSLYNLSLSNRG